MDCTSVFVYGTLKKDQLRGTLWPRGPICIEPAIAQGLLWDLGSYPGLIPGDDPILGEVWTFEPCDIIPTLETLDAIEGYDPKSDTGLYLRRKIDVHLLSQDQKQNPPLRCFTYMIPDINVWPKARRIKPRIDKHHQATLVAWPDEQSHVPRSLLEDDAP